MQNNEKKIKYFLYARKSSEAEDRQVASIDSQVDELTKIAKRENLAIIDILSESQSAKAPGRPIFNKMLERIYNGEACGILCWKLDRLARNPIDGGNISWTLQKGIIQHIRAYDRSYYPTDNVLIMSVELGMANQFVRDLSQNTKRGLKTKAERGWRPTSAPVGYKFNPIKKKGDKEIIKDEERFDLLKKMFDSILTRSKSPLQILNTANNEWGFKMPSGKPMARSSFYRILSDTFYYGTFEHPKGSGNWYKGIHEPMISELEYNKIQVILGKKTNPRPKSHTFAYTGLIKCGECGGMITAENKIKRQKNGNIHQYTYYHCTKRKNNKCSQKTIRLENLEIQISNVLKKIEIPQEFCEWALDIIKQENTKESENRNKIIQSQQKTYNACVRKIDALIDMRANNEITEQEFSKKKSHATKEKLKLQELLNDSDKRVDNWIETAEQLFNFAKIAKTKFENGTLEDKKIILSTLGSNLVLKDQNLSILLQKPLLSIEKAAFEVKAISKRFEPLKNSEDKRTMGEIYSQSPVLHGWRESDPR